MFAFKAPNAYDELLSCQMQSVDYWPVEDIFWFSEAGLGIKLERRRHFEVLQGRVERATEHSVEYDLFSSVDVTIEPGARFVVPTGVFTNMSVDLCAIIKEKSGLAARGIGVGGGVIDADYKKEWGVILRNFGDSAFNVVRGLKIAQFKIEVIPVVNVVGVTLLTAKRDGGFGSTGA
jgi:dUTP pyrophosphatase